MKNKLAIVFITSLLCSTVFSSPKAQEADSQMNSAPQVEMVSGGIGDGGMEAIEEKQKDYSLKLVFADADGEYLADVKVLIKDRKGNEVVNTDSVGPVLLLKLKPGVYTVSSTTNKETKSQKVTVRNKGTSSYYVHINAAES